MLAVHLNGLQSYLEPMIRQNRLSPDRGAGIGWIFTKKRAQGQGF
jgi:hypothetical protein